jgi:hypothetical protein
VANEFSTGSFFVRWLFAIALVFSTYNPTGYSYANWIIGAGTDIGPVMALAGVALLIAWIVFLRATFMSLGAPGIALGAALFACIIWLLIDLGLLSLDSTGALSWVILLVLSIMLAAGMSWSHIRRRLTGQFDVDEKDN